MDHYTSVITHTPWKDYFHSHNLRFLSLRYYYHYVLMVIRGAVKKGLRKAENGKDEEAKST